MALLLSPDLEARVHEKMHSAGYQSPEEVIRRALDALDSQEQPELPAPVAKDIPPSLPPWKRFEQAGRSLPERELAALPPDGASEHDHYLYGTPMPHSHA
jgi:hypothetical protein